MEEIVAYICAAADIANANNTKIAVAAAFFCLAFMLLLAAGWFPLS